MLTVKMKRVSVLLGFGVEFIRIEIDAPSPFPAMQDPAVLRIEAANGAAIQWCKEMGIPIDEVIDQRGNIICGGQ